MLMNLLKLNNARRSCPQSLAHMALTNSPSKVDHLLNQTMLFLLQIQLRILYLFVLMIQYHLLYRGERRFVWRLSSSTCSIPLIILHSKEAVSPLIQKRRLATFAHLIHKDLYKESQKSYDLFSFRQYSL